MSLLLEFEHLRAEVAAFVQSVHRPECIGSGSVVAGQVLIVLRMSVGLQQLRSQLVQNSDAPVVLSQLEAGVRLHLQQQILLVLCITVTPESVVEVDGFRAAFVGLAKLAETFGYCCLPLIVVPMVQQMR